MKNLIRFIFVLFVLCNLPSDGFSQKTRGGGLGGVAVDTTGGGILDILYTNNISSRAGSNTISMVADVTITARSGVGLRIVSTSSPQFVITHTAGADSVTQSVDGNGLFTITTVDGGGAAGHIVLMPDGNVGIGIATPGVKFDVFGVENAPSIRILSGANDKFTTLTMGRTAEEGVWGIAGQVHNFFREVAVGDMIVRVDDPTKKMHLGIGDGSVVAELTLIRGSVGINTPIPTGQLTIDGNKTTDNLFEAINDDDGSVGDSSTVVNKLGYVGVGAVPSTSLHVDSNGANTVAIATIENTSGDFQIFRIDATPESAVTGSIGDLAIDGTGGVLYFKQSGSASNTGWLIIGGTPTFKSYSLSNPGNSGTFYVGGHYAFAAADANLTIGGGVTQTFGTAGQAHGSHAFCVASGAGGTDLVLTVTGVSITDAGVKNDSDTEIIVADADAAITDEYFETSKKWLGQITYTLTGAAGAFDFNYGFVKYEDFGNKAFTVTDFEATGEARANETGLNIELLYHESGAFVYDAAAFIPNQTALVSLATDYGTNNDVASGDGFAYKRIGMSTAVAGNAGEGLLIRITTAVNNSINDATFHIGATLK